LYTFPADRPASPANVNFNFLSAIYRLTSYFQTLSFILVYFWSMEVIMKSFVTYLLTFAEAKHAFGALTLPHAASSASNAQIMPEKCHLLLVVFV